MPEAARSGEASTISVDHVPSGAREASATMVGNPYLNATRGAPVEVSLSTPAPVEGSA